MQISTFLNGSFFGLSQGLQGFMRSEAERVPLGASPALLVRILGGNIVLESMFGHSRFEEHSLLVPALFLCLGVLVVFFGLRWGPPGLRYFSLYALLLLTASLRSPVIIYPSPRWYALTQDQGMRYYFFPAMVFLWAAVYCFARCPLRWVRLGCVGLALLFIHGLLSWRYSTFTDEHFDHYVEVFEHAWPGQTVVFPIYPEPWTMTLHKH